MQLRLNTNVSNDSNMLTVSFHLFSFHLINFLFPRKALQMFPYDHVDYYEIINKTMSLILKEG